ncbi:MAG: hypothetical protein Solivirus1_27 [Solivirus sp.]|uniref:Uncharacterized protein n=1 Tax=Solivirus sp. TaxID=2487772 RepID=A0A3G5AFA6_9VIRU|nr:MAG: hypothetical protein Solivirus1_27 [Solivirus sp.]
MDSEVYELFTKLYNTNIYLANRLLVDFPDEVIEELEKSRKYPDLFTPSLQNDLYMLKLEKFGLLAEFINQFRDRISNKNLYNIFKIFLFDKELIRNLFLQASQADDPMPFEILVRLYNVGVLQNIYNKFLTFSHLGYHIFSKAPRILKFLLSLDDPYFSDQVLSYLAGFDMVTIEEFLPFLGDLDQLTDDIKRILFISSRSASPETIKYFVQKYGIKFNGEIMAEIAHSYHDREFIYWLIQHGSSPIDRVFYNVVFGRGFERGRANPDYLNQ